MCYFPTPNTAHQFALRTRSELFYRVKDGWGGEGGRGEWEGGGIAHTALFISRRKKMALRSRSARGRLSHLQVAHNHDEGRPRSRRAAALLVALA